MYEKLRRVQISERSSNKLSEIEGDMYREAEGYIDKLKEKLTKNWDMRTVREIENCEKVLQDIKRRRAEKILVYALNEVYNDLNPLTGLASEEVQLYEKIKKIIDEYKNGVEISEDENEIREEVKREVNSDTVKNENKDIINVKVLKDLPKFKGLDGSEYGPFAAGSVYSVPKTEGEVLIKRNVAVPV